MPHKISPEFSVHTGGERRLVLATYGCSIVAGIGLLSLTLGRSGGWAMAWMPLGTGIFLALAGAGGLVLRARHRRHPPAQQAQSLVRHSSFANPEVWREIDGNRDLLYALLELSRRRMRDAVSQPTTPSLRVGSRDQSCTGDGA